MFLLLVHENLFVIVKLKIIDGIVITDVLDHFPNKRNVIGDQPFSNVFCHHITQYSSEVFVPWKRQKASTVCEHSYKLT